MITYRQGNLLETDAEAVVNTVNTVGVMGKGIALMFKERYPENYRAYAAACRAGEVQTGRMFVTATNELSGPRWIINFPTKENWRNPSRPEWIVEGPQGSGARYSGEEHPFDRVAAPRVRQRRIGLVGSSLRDRASAGRIRRCERDRF